MNTQANRRPAPGRKPDKRVARTRHELLRAFAALMKERGWDDITVGDVCLRAGLARSTFYAHHASKDSLLIGALDVMREDLRAAVEQSGARGEPFGYARALLRNAFAHPDHHRMLVDRRTDFVVQRRFRELVKTLIARDLARLMPDHSRLEPAAHFVGGGLFELMTWGVNSSDRVTVDEVIDEFLRLVAPLSVSCKSTSADQPAGYRTAARAAAGSRRRPM